MDPAEYITDMQPVQLMGIEITDAEDGTAQATLPMQREICYDVDDTLIISGVATYALADAAGAAAMISTYDEIQPAPTVDMRIDYLNIAQSDIYAEAVVEREGRSVSYVDVDLYDEDDTRVAYARGVYISR